MEVLLLLLGAAFINIVYNVGKLYFALRWGIHHQHYFLGKGPKLFSVTFHGITCTFGIYLPLPGLSSIYEYGSGKKERAQSSWEFYGHSILKRFIVATGGVLALSIACIQIFTILAYYEKESYISQEEVNRYGIYPSTLALEAGFETGDKVLSIDGKAFENYEELLYPKANSRYTVLRGEEQLEIAVSDSILSNSSVVEGSYPFLTVLAPFKISTILPGSTAESAGLQVGDQITEINNTAVRSFDEFKSALATDEDRAIDLSVRREGEPAEILLSGLPLSPDGKLGFSQESLLQYTYKQNTALEALAKGITTPFKILTLNLKGFYKIFSGEVSTTSKEIGGPIGVTELYGNEYLWQRFWTITAMLGIWIAFITLLPLPNTSFWEIVPLGYEASTKKRFPYEVYRKTKRLGFYLVIAIIVWVMIGDILTLLTP